MYKYTTFMHVRDRLATFCERLHKRLFRLLGLRVVNKAYMPMAKWIAEMEAKERKERVNEHA